MLQQMQDIVFLINATKVNAKVRELYETIKREKHLLKNAPIGEREERSKMFLQEVYDLRMQLKWWKNQAVLEKAQERKAMREELERRQREANEYENAGSRYNVTYEAKKYVYS